MDPQLLPPGPLLHPESFPNTPGARAGLFGGRERRTKTRTEGKILSGPFYLRTPFSQEPAARRGLPGRAAIPGLEPGSGRGCGKGGRREGWRRTTTTSPAQCTPFGISGPKCPLVSNSICLKFNCRSPFEALEASEALSHPHPPFRAQKVHLSQIQLPFSLGGLGGLREALTTSKALPNVPPSAFPTPIGHFCLKFNFRAPFEASEALSQPQRPCPMYPLRHFRPQLATFVSNSICAPPWRPPRRSHILTSPSQCTPSGISGPKWPFLSKIELPSPLGGLVRLGGLRGALTTSPPRPNVPPLAFPAAHGPFCLKFNCRAPLEPLEASEELSQPHPLAPMYPLWHFRPQMAPCV